MARPGELAAVWRDAGFRDIREAKLTIRVGHGDFQDFWGPTSAGKGRSPTTWPE